MHRFAQLAGFAGAALALGPAHASGTATGAMAVSVTVAPGCNLQAGALDFGTVESDRPAGSARAALALRCTPGAAYSVTLDEGQHGARRMAAADGGALLDYEIFQDAAATRRWGSDSSGAVSGVADTGAVSLSAYGRIVSRAATPGSYGDVITVTVQF